MDSICVGLESVLAPIRTQFAGYGSARIFRFAESNGQVLMTYKTNST